MARVNSKSTKAEILEAYKELEKEKQELEKAVSNQQSAPATKSEPTTEEKTVKLSQETQPNVNAQRKMNQVIEGLSNIKLGFSGAVSDLSEQLTNEAGTLSQVRTLVSEETEELRALHELETVTDNTLDELIASYQETEKTLAEEFEQRKETLNQEIETLQRNWQKEKENHQREVKGRNEEHRKTKEREEEEYRYNLELERELSEEGFEQRKKTLYKELNEARQEQEQAWEERENAIAEREKEYNQAKEKVEAFPEKLEQAVKKAQEEGKRIGNYQVKVKADLRGKEVEGERRNYQLQIQGLQESINSQETRLHNLSQQLNGALKQVQDLAVKAIEGASSKESFQSLKEIVLEQTKNQPKGKS